MGSAPPLPKAHPEALLYRHGHVIGRTVASWIPQSCCPGSTSAAYSDRLYRMGVRYVKNDYNQSVGVGIDTHGAPDRNGALALSDHAAAVLSLVDEICTAYPDFIIESCCSGAMRSTLGAVRHFLPAVKQRPGGLPENAIGYHGVICLPAAGAGRRMGVPYPVAIDYRDSFRSSEEFTAGFADGRVTVHNMVSGLMGLMYLSGHIDCR